LRSRRGRSGRDARRAHARFQEIPSVFVFHEILHHSFAKNISRQQDQQRV
jgi:hypothetical protein